MATSAESEQGLGRGAAKALATRAAILEVAAELFAERGYVESSVRDIARRGEVSSGAIYGHFRSKADLLAEAISMRTADELEAPSTDSAGEGDYVETLTRLGREFAKRRRLRALIVQGAAAAQTDDETRTRLRGEQAAHIEAWLEGYERDRDRMGIHPSVDMQAALLYTWAAELGLGVLESFGIEPASAEGWAEVQNRLARSLKLAPDDQPPTDPTARA
jgi:AcrR family transcriptional regulator